jgi:hypothetical protein
LTGPPLTKLRVASLSGFESPYEIKPHGGLLHDGRDVTVVVHAERDILIDVERKLNSKGEASIFVACHVINDAGEDMPVTLSSLHNICRLLTKKGKDAAASLEAMELEKRNLRAWLRAPISKPLAHVGQAKARIAALDESLPAQAAAVESIRADLAVAESLHAVAVELHESAALEIASAE